MGDTSVGRPRARFKTAVAIMIAAATVAGALVTWRISVEGGKADSADAQGLAAALNSANTAISVSTYLNNNLGFFVSYRQHLFSAELMEREAASPAAASRKESLRQAARRERNLAATARAYIDADYLEVDPSDGREYFNGNRYWDAQWASARARMPLDEQPFFARADAGRRDCRRLALAMVGLGAALFLFVASHTAGRRRFRYLFAGAGMLLFLASGAAAVFVTLAR